MTEEATDKVHVQAWFIVVIDNDGRPVVLTQFPDADIESAREATMQDVRSACSEVLADINVKSVAHEVAAMLAPAQPATSAERIAKRLQDRKED